MTIQKIIYTAVVLDHTKVILFPREKRMAKEYANFFFHHVTVQFGVEGTELPDYIGERVEFSVDDTRKDESAMSFHGHFSNCSNGKVLQEIKQLVAHPHITIATSEGVKPVYAGTMSDDKIIATFPNRQFYGRIGAFCVFADGTTGWVFGK